MLALCFGAMHITSKSIIASALLLLVAAPAQAGEFYSDQAVAGAKANVKNFAWAKKEADEIIAYAKPWMTMSYDQVWNFLSEQSIPRALWTGKPPRCPIHGSLEAHGDYAYTTIPENRWKVRCPVGGETWPTNDFEAYYKSGKNGNNLFDPARANRGLLYSQDPSRGYGVDDGNGYVDGAGNRYHFVGYYAFWGIWNRIARSDYNAVTVLSKAYLLTGDAEYARRAALLIARAADLYAALDTSYWTARGVTANDGGTNMGKALGNIWDDDVANNLMLAYDAVGDFIDADPKTQQLLGGYGQKYGLAPQATAAQIQAHIKNNLLAKIAAAVKARQIRSNEGRAQYTLGLASLLQKSSAATADALAWLNAPGDNYNGGGHLPQLFWELIDRDGAGTESSPFYNGIWLEALQPLADVIQRMDKKQNLFEAYPRFAKLLHYPGRLMSLGKYYPHVGDSGATGSPEAPLPNLAERYVKAYLQFNDEESALMAYELNGDSAEGLNAGLFGGDARALVGDIKAVVAARGRQWKRSDNMNGYGLATHRAGIGNAARAAWLYAGRTGHGGNHPHADRLNLGLFAWGLDLMPDLGYPEYAIAWPTTQGWIKNTVAHNTVVVDGRRQAETYAGDQKVFADTPYVQFSEVDGGDVYPQTSMYKRSVAMIQINDQDSYMVDLFRVQGGGEHVYSFHTAEGQPTTEGLALTAQGGTYAGPNIGYGNFYDEPFSGTYSGSGFQFLDNVAADAGKPATFSADWKIVDTRNLLPAEWKDKVHLKMTMVGNEGEVAFADGRPAQNNGSNPRRLRYMLVKNRGDALQSRFLGVIEPYLSSPSVKSIKMLPVAGTTDKNVVALEIKLKTGRTDYVFSALDNETHTTEDKRFTFRGRFGVYAEKGGETAFAFLADEGELTVDGQAVAGAKAAAGKVVAVDASETGAVVTVDALVPDDGSYAGRWVDFAPQTPSDANFRVEKVDNQGGQSKLVLSGADPYFGFNTPGDAASGLKSVIAPGGAFRIPAAVFERGPAYEALLTDFELSPADASPTRAAAAGDASGGCNAGRGSPLWMLSLVVGLTLRRWLRRRSF